VSGPIPDVAAMITVGAIVTTIAAVLGGGYPDHPPSLRSVASIAAMALAGTVLTFLLWNEAVRRIGASRSSIYMNLLPVFTVLIAAASGQPPTLAQLLGGALVIGAVAWSSWPVRAKVAEGASP
jgi:drug/metabolite transporter (DMT)-like permease